MIKAYDEKATFETNDLKCWADQGVLLLNAALSVLEHKPGSLTAFWAPVVIDILNEVYLRNADAVFLSFGAHAEKIVNAVAMMSPYHVRCYHPAYIARRKMRGDQVKPNPFKEVNRMLEQSKRDPINWSTWKT
jgi:uracil-DNA glycosylase